MITMLKNQQSCSLLSSKAHYKCHGYWFEDLNHSHIFVDCACLKRKNVAPASRTFRCRINNAVNLASSIGHKAITAANWDPINRREAASIQIRRNCLSLELYFSMHRNRAEANLQKGMTTRKRWKNRPFLQNAIHLMLAGDYRYYIINDTSHGNMATNDSAECAVINAPHIERTSRKSILSG